MDSPTPVRFTANQQASLRNAQITAGLKQAEVVRLAVEEIFKKYPTDGQLIEAIILHRTAQAAQLAADSGVVKGRSTKKAKAR